LNRAKKFVYIVFFAIAIIISIVLVIARSPAVECMVLEKGVIETSFTETGEVIPLWESHISTEIGGKLIEVIAIEGASVRKGDLLFVFDGSDLKDEEKSILAELMVLDSQINNQLISLETQLNTLKANKASAQVQLEMSKIDAGRKQNDFESAKMLYEIGGISTQDYESYKATYDVAAKIGELANIQLREMMDQIADVESQIKDLREGKGVDVETGASPSQQLLGQKAGLEVKLNLLRDNLSKLELFATQDGIIRDVFVKEGYIIPQGTKLCSVYQPNQYRVDCYLLVENVEGVSVGDEVYVTLKLQDEDKVFRGTVVVMTHDAMDIVSKAGLVEKRFKIEINVEEEGWENVGPYWPVKIRFITAKEEDCLVVPRTALFEDSNNIWKVWKVQRGRLVSVMVERGLQTSSEVEIKGYVGPGDVIVKKAKADNMFDGKTVRKAF